MCRLEQQQLFTIRERGHARRRGHGDCDEHADLGPASAFLAPLRKVSTIGSTVPGNGDVNPYGLVRLTASVGKLRAGMR